jgi:hypothetical protein
MERNVLKERLMNKDDKNRHFVLLIIDISKHGAKEMGHVKMAGPGFVNDVEIMAFVIIMSTRWIQFKVCNFQH